jgi:hypothetical protein
MKNIELQILFDFFQNLLLEVHQGHLGMYKKLNYKSNFSFFKT